MRRSIPLALFLGIAGASAAVFAAEQTDGNQRSYNSKTTLNQALAGLTPGKPVDCLPFTRTPSSDSFGQTVVYRYSSDKKYVTNVGPGCEGLARGDIMISRTSYGRFCRGDIIQLVNPVSRFPTGSCAYGDFTPYTKAGKAK